MSVQHVVAIKLKQDTPADDVAALKDGVRSLKDIPGVLSVTFGNNFTQRADFDIVLVITLQDKATLDVHQAHDRHKEVVAKYIAPVKANLIALDFVEEV